MHEELDEERIKEFASQLRKPEGENGSKIGHLMNEGNGPMNMHTLAVLNPKENNSILEIGMGNGYFVKHILNSHPSILYTGCDFSELMVQESISNNSNFISEDRAHFVESNMEKLPF